MGELTDYKVQGQWVHSKLAIPCHCCENLRGYSAWPAWVRARRVPPSCTGYGVAPRVLSKARSPPRSASKAVGPGDADKRGGRWRRGCWRGGGGGAVNGGVATQPSPQLWEAGSASLPKRRPTKLKAPVHTTADFPKPTVGFTLEAGNHKSPKPGCPPELTYPITAPRHAGGRKRQVPKACTRGPPELTYPITAPLQAGGRKRPVPKARTRCPPELTYPITAPLQAGGRKRPVPKARTRCPPELTYPITAPLQAGGWKRQVPKARALCPPELTYPITAPLRPSGDTRCPVRVTLCQISNLPHPISVSPARLVSCLAQPDSCVLQTASGLCLCLAQSVACASSRPAPAWWKQIQGHFGYTWEQGAPRLAAALRR
ncbi:hypothetical protein H8959_006593 [Pygathrix nigripes]